MRRYNTMNVSRNISWFSCDTRVFASLCSIIIGTLIGKLITRDFYFLAGVIREREFSIFYRSFVNNIAYFMLREVSKFYLVWTILFQIKKAVPPLSLHGQLLWREFFYCAATKNPNFDRMQGNPICVQIPWDKNVEALAKWANVSEF